MGTNNLYEYSLIFNVTVVPSSTATADVPDTRTANSDNFTIDAYKTWFSEYVNSGFI
jgi:hypothetical protein